MSLAKRSLFWPLVPVTLVSACGLLLFAAADSGGRSNAIWAMPLFWLSLFVLVVPIALRLGTRNVSRRERLGLVIVIGFFLYLVKVLRDPLEFSNFDEFEFWPVADSILSTGHLFHSDPLSEVAPYYPGLQIVMSAVAQVGQLSTFHSGIVVIGIGRIVLAISLFLLYERTSNSDRVAGLATLMYMANPNFLFFDSQCGYESLSLALAALTLLLASEVVGERGYDRGGLFALSSITTLGLVVVVITHHLTSYAILAALCLWALIVIGSQTRLVDGFHRFHAGDAAYTHITATARTLHGDAYALGQLALRSRERASFGRLARLGLTVFVCIVVWNLLVARTTMGYLASPLSGAFTQFWHLIIGQSTSKTPFSGASGQVQIWDSVSGYLSVLLILVVLPIGIFHIWSRYRHNALALTLALVGAAYPVSLGLRLTPAGTETSNRSSEFIYLGVAFVLAVAFEGWWLPKQPARLHSWNRPGVLASGIMILFVGGICVGTAPSARLPGPFLVGGDQRSVDTAGVGAAQWAFNYLGRNNRIVADRMNQQLMGAYGGQIPVRASPAGLGIESLFFSPNLSPDNRAMIQSSKIAYVETDRRLTTALSLQGYYFDADEPRSKTPLPAADLNKFDHVSGISRVFDSGAIALYDIASVNSCVSPQSVHARCTPHIPVTALRRPAAFESASTPTARAVLRILAALLLVTMLPGCTVVGLLSISVRLESTLKLVLIPGASLFVVILGGLILNLTPWGLQAGSWIVLLGGIIFSGAAMMLWSGRSAVRIVRTKVDSGILSWLLLMVALLPAILVSSLAFSLSSGGATRAQRLEVHYTQFWLLPTAINSTHVSASLGISNVRSGTTQYEIRVFDSGSGKVVREWRDILLRPGESWGGSFRTGLAKPGRLTADLYVVESQASATSGHRLCGTAQCGASRSAEARDRVPYREAFLWHN